MTELELIIDFYRGTERQGPGSDVDTLRALDAMHLDLSKSYKVADIGCGSGGQTITLANALKGEIVGVDLFPEFLTELDESAKLKGLGNKISTLEANMDALPFAEKDFDIIWSEGAIYNMGFERGIQEWSRFLKSGGYIALSEISWTTDSRPEEIQDHWMKEYPEIDTAQNKIQILERNDFRMLNHFFLPESSWEEYYKPLELKFEEFLVKHENSDLAKRVVQDQRREIDLYRKYKSYYSYGFYVAQMNIN
jgi:ubiquinone/menaquinone biosynthesis C-methylase UbiE